MIENNEKVMKEAVQTWADSLAIHLAEEVPHLSKYTCQVLLQLFTWPQVLNNSLATSDFIEKLQKRIDL